MHQKILKIKSKMKEDSTALNLFNTDFYYLKLTVTWSPGLIPTADNRKGNHLKLNTLFTRVSIIIIKPEDIFHCALLCWTFYT